MKNQIITLLLTTVLIPNGMGGLIGRDLSSGQTTTILPNGMGGYNVRTLDLSPAPGRYVPMPELPEPSTLPDLDDSSLWD
jgi:hypothetical protein